MVVPGEAVTSAKRGRPHGRPDRRRTEGRRVDPSESIALVRLEIVSMGEEPYSPERVQEYGDWS